MHMVIGLGFIHSYEWLSTVSSGNIGGYPWLHKVTSGFGGYECLSCMVSTIHDHTHMQYCKGGGCVCMF